MDPYHEAGIESENRGTRPWGGTAVLCVSLVYCCGFVEDEGFLEVQNVNSAAKQRHYIDILASKARSKIDFL